jgi:hypothetical protein
MKTVIHVGPWKTGTTSIQAMLARGRTRLSSEGIRYEPDFGHSHVLLANALSQFPDSSLPQPPGESDVDDAHVTLISAEHLASADPAKVQHWRDHRPPCDYVVVAAVREPMSWMVSVYLQHARLRPLPFHEFVRTRIESRMLLLSDLVRRWSPLSPTWAFMRFSRETDITTEFINAVNLSVLRDLGGQFRDNASTSIEESLYTALLSSRLDQYWRYCVGGEIPRSFAADSSLEQFLTMARPVFEYSRRNSGDVLLASGAVVEEPPEFLLDWRSLWLADAKDVAVSLGLAESALGRQLTTLEGEAADQLWPTGNCLELLPVDAIFESVCRTVSVAVNADMHAAMP